MVALLSELSLDDWKGMLERFVREQGIDLGMCADVNIHDPYPPGHNPHSHILFTMRPLDEHGKRIKAVKPELDRYAGLVQHIKEKSKERKNLLVEKKETPFYQIPKMHDLPLRITELTEEIEELKTEKNFLLCSLDCADDAGISGVKKEIAILEGALQKLSEQEEKYSAELDKALKQYAELKKQADGMDAAELMDARLAVREEKEHSAIDRVKTAYGEKYDTMMMYDSKRDVVSLLNEEIEERSIMEKLRIKQREQKQQIQRKTKQKDLER